jgi:transposase-like protein
MSGKRYTEEFKVEAVKQITERGHPVAEVASRLGGNDAQHGKSLAPATSARSLLDDAF